MDDLTQQLNQILSNPQTMGQLQKLLGGGEDAAPPQESSAGTPDLSALLGALLVMGCDLAARMVLAPYELPVGIVLSFIGAPFFIWLLIHQRRRGSHD